MKKILAVVLFLSGFFTGFSQFDEAPVSWSQELLRESPTEFTLVMRGKIKEGWHVYSQFTPEGGSQPSYFTYVDEGDAYVLIGKTEESETTSEYVDVFDLEEIFFKGEAVFTQRIRLQDVNLKTIKVDLWYQVCKEVCIPADVSFYFSLDGSSTVQEEKEIDERSVAMSDALKLNLTNDTLLNSKDVVNLDSDSGIWTIFGWGFLGGLIALLTPCVFPMIPLTVSFFTKRSERRSSGVVNALAYGFFIVLIYFLLSVPFHLFDSVDSQILNTVATNRWLNVVFFVIFVFFAFSFFGYYELTLPSSWANKMDSASTKVGGFMGIFFMAVTLAIVSFSCTGPILGGLLGSTALADGDVATNLSAGMTGFGTALALPFALFALFPALLGSLPKSGGWMTTVKVVLGFLELALALKFLSNADLVGHWGILKREVFVIVWIILFLAMAAYLFGFFRFPHDGPKQKLALPRKTLALATTGFSLYLVLGLITVTDLRFLSGLLPPDFYSIFEKENDCPLGLDCYKDFEVGLEAAKSSGKPVLLDFTGWACSNCRDMEENVWSDPDIFRIMNNELVLISLYVDDSATLPKDAQFDFKYDSGRIKKINTVGRKWGTFQTLNFGAASQPYYVLLSPDMKLLNHPIQKTDIKTYHQWLVKGISEIE